MVRVREEEVFNTSQILNGSGEIILITKRKDGELRFVNQWFRFEEDCGSSKKWGVERFRVKVIIEEV